MKLLSPLAHYHNIYLIVKLFQINLCSYGLKIVLFLLDLSLTPIHCFMNFKHPYYILNIKIRLMLH
jgi:hypothetical protein